MFASLVMGQVKDWSCLYAERFYASAYCMQEESNQSSWITTEVRSCYWGHHRGIASTIRYTSFLN